MSYPSLLKLDTAAQYRMHFENIYCRGVIATFDGIAVRFRKSNFNHCFFESTNRDGTKDQFSVKRAERMDWIKATLRDNNAKLYEGWDKKRKKYDGSRRVAVVMENYIVVIAIIDNSNANFVTAYVADTARTLEMIEKGPRWEKTSA